MEDDLETVHNNLDYIHTTLEDDTAIDEETWQLVEPKIVKSWVLLEEVKKSLASQ